MGAPSKRYGKRPARLGAVKLAFRSYFSPADLPKPPTVFGNHTLIRDWGMFGNDTYSDCVFAGAAHETMLWLAQVGTPRQFSTANALSDYAAVTGFNPAKPDTDQGTDMQQAASYRQKTGVIDAGGIRHKIDAYVALEPVAEQVALAAYLTGAVGIGLRMPDTADGQFDRGEPWDVVRGVRGTNGHYVPVVGRNSAGNFIVVTWGRLQAMTPDFLSAFMDEGIAYLSRERLKNEISPEGFNYAALQSDLDALANQPAQGAPMATPNIQGTKIDPDMVAAVVAAIKPVVGTFTYRGVRVGEYVTADELQQVSAAAVAAVIDYQTAPSI